MDVVVKDDESYDMLCMLMVVMAVAIVTANRCNCCHYSTIISYYFVRILT
jgi:hypothetical protein